MLYYLFQLLQNSGLPGVRLMTYISFRSGVAFVLALCLAIFVGRTIIDRLRKLQVGEIVRKLGLEGQSEKAGTPTMGGIIIIMSVMIPSLLVGNLSNVYMLLMLLTTVWLGALGFTDDYLKLRRHNKDGMSGKAKIAGQLGLGAIVVATMYFSPDIVMKQNSEVCDLTTHETEVVYSYHEIKAPQTTIPFVKDNNFDYSMLTGWMGKWAEAGGWILYALVTVFAIVATSNGANLTDGLDGLCTGVSTPIVIALGIMAYLGGNVIYSAYLNIMYIPGSEELVVFMSAFVGALIGFLWYNASPAEVFMGDTGSLTIGGIVAVFAILIRKELLLPLLCGIYMIEDLSVILQTGYFKLTRKFTGTGKRIFKMTPLHHHFQKSGNAGIDALIQAPVNPVMENRLVVRLCIISVLFVALTFVTLKVR